MNNNINDVVSLHIANLKKKRDIRELEEQLDVKLYEINMCNIYNDHMGASKYRETYNRLQDKYRQMTNTTYQPKDD